MSDSLLSPYRVLDLTVKNGHFCGKIFADLGADVIKVEPPGGDPARNVGPFYRDIPHPEHNLYWWSFNTNKRGITLDITSPEGQETFRRLVRNAQFVIESFPPGYLDRLGLGYSALSQLNPGIILISITAFGQTGPYTDLKVSDIALMALGGQMFGAGFPDRPPVRPSVPQAFLLASAHGAAAGMTALYYRLKTGLGQHVDISAQACVARLMSLEHGLWEFNHELSHREGSVRPGGGGLQVQIVWPCKDGNVTFRPGVGGYLRGLRPLVAWMEQEGLAGKLKGFDWDSLSPLVTFDKEVESWQKLFGAFFLSHTKAELYEGALQRHIPLFPVFTPREIVQDHQLSIRNFWVSVEHAELGASFTYPGAPLKIPLTPWKIKRRAPLIGEHNKEVLSQLEGDPQKLNEPNEPNELNGLNGLNEPNELKELKSKVLEGLKVLDFTWFLAGPLITKYFADFGARVVKIESNKNFDMTRASLPYKDGIPGLDRSSTYRLYNTSKLSMALKLSIPEGQAVAKKLAAWADVVVENFTPGVLARWGLDYENLRKVNPDLIMLSTSNQGQYGPHSRHPGFGWNLSGLGGFNHLTGYPDREGIEPNSAYNDFASPWFGVVTVLGALGYRDRTGRGQYIDLSQYEAGLCYLSVPMLDFAINGREWTRKGNQSDHACPHAAYPCKGKDRWCVISICTETEWQTLCQVMGKPIMAGDSRFATFKDRKQNEEELNRLIGLWTQERTAEAIMDMLQKAGISAGVVENMQDLLEKDPQLRHRGYFHLLEHPTVGKLWHQGWPADLSRTPYKLRYAPSLGEHTDMVCRDILKLSDEEIKELKATGVLE